MLPAQQITEMGREHNGTLWLASYPFDAGISHRYINGLESPLQVWEHMNYLHSFFSRKEGGTS